MCSHASCTFVCACMLQCVCIYLHICMCMDIYAYTYMHVCMHVKGSLHLQLSYRAPGSQPQIPGCRERDKVALVSLARVHTSHLVRRDTCRDVLLLGHHSCPSCGVRMVLPPVPTPSWGTIQAGGHGLLVHPTCWGPCGTCCGAVGPGGAIAVGWVLR